jgi:hypothetical protein
MEVELSCDLTEEEVQYRAQQLGAAVVEQDEVTTHKRDANKGFNEELEEIAQRMRLLSRAIRNKSERRLVRCAVTFHTPTQGAKRVVRLDTGELVREEPMTLDECQQHLFEAD